MKWLQSKTKDSHVGKPKWNVPSIKFTGQLAHAHL